MRERKRRKTFRLPQPKIDKAVAILGARTETEAIEHALDLIAGVTQFEPPSLDLERPVVDRSP